MILRPSTAPQRVPLPSNSASSLPVGPDPESDSLRAASPTVTRFLATTDTDPVFESTAASALVAKLSASASVCPPSVGGECALGTDVLEDKQEEFECFAASVPHLVSMLLATEGDPDAPDISTPRSYAEAIQGPYSSQWQAAMDAEMASWKSTVTYVDEVPPPGANIVSGMWIFRVKRPPGSPPAFKARYVARGFSQRQGVDFFQTFSPTSKMTTLWAPREWHDTLRTTLAALGFAPSTADPSLFFRTDTTLPPFYVLVYVDDLVFATADTEALAHVKSELQKRHTCTDLVTHGTGDRTGEQCGGLHSTQRCFGRLTDAWRHQFPDATEIPRWGDLSRAGVAVFDLDYDAILAAMYALSTSDEGDCYLCVPPDPSIQAAALGAGETAALGASVYAAPGAGESAPSGTASAQTEGAEPGGAGTGGAEPGGAESGGVETWGAEPGGAATGGTEPGGAEPGVTEPGGAEPGGAGRATGAGGTPATTGSGGTRLGGAGATGPGGTAEAAGVGPTGGSAGASGGTGAAGSAGPGATGATLVGAAGGVGAGGSVDAGASEGTGAGAVPAGSGGAPRPRPYFVPLLEQVLGLPPSPGPAPPFECPQPVQSQSLLQPVSPLPAPSPYTGPTGGLVERRAPASRPASPARPACTSRRTSRPRPPAVPGTHQMALRPSIAPLRVQFPSPPASSLPAFPDPESDSLHAASPTVARFLATVVTDPSLASTAASALVAELVDFAARCRLNYAASLVAESASVCPPSVGGECALSTDVLEDRQEEFQCFAAALPHLAAMDAEMASWKSTGTYVDEVPPPGANIVSGMWIFRVKRPPGSPPVFKARYVARGFSSARRNLVDIVDGPSGPYPELVGCLMYLMTCTRPDLAYPLSILARYVAPGRHRPEHMAAAKRVLRYLCSTSGMGLVLGGRRPVVLSGHADASWADDQATQRSS
ncbi:unnamed protein product [Closterium sp. NIES-54]